MQERDVLSLDENERKLLDLSFQTGLHTKRIRHVALDVAVVSALVIVATAYGLHAGWLAALAVALLIVTGLEKVSQARTLLHYRTLVRKLVHRVEQLEGRQPTALGAHPAAELQQRLALEREAESRPRESRAADSETARH